MYRSPPSRSQLLYRLVNGKHSERQTVSAARRRVRPSKPSPSRARTVTMSRGLRSEHVLYAPRPPHAPSFNTSILSSFTASEARINAKPYTDFPAADARGNANTHQSSPFPLSPPLFLPFPFLSPLPLVSYCRPGTVSVNTAPATRQSCALPFSFSFVFFVLIIFDSMRPVRQRCVHSFPLSDIPLLYRLERRL
jgi:hypothetical protein